MSYEIFHILFAILTIVLSFLTVEIEDLFKASMAFCLTEVSLATVFYLVGAPLVAVFQLVIYAGAVTVLFLAALHTIGGSTAKLKINVFSLIIALLSLAIIAFFSFSTLHSLIPTVPPSRPPIEEYLWSYRGLDILIQAFIILAGAAAVAALFRVEKTLKSSKTATKQSDEEEEKHSD
jgi:NADH-quinone oxidoreductase subunit J